VILETPAECEDKIKGGVRLLHCNGVSESRLSFSTISAVFERVGD